MIFVDNNPTNRDLIILRKFILENIQNEIKINNKKYKHPYVDADLKPKQRICITCMNRNHH